MQHLIEFLNKLVDDFSWKRLSLILSCLALVIIALVAYEFYTSYFFLSKTEKTINLIKQLSSLPPEVTNSSKDGIANLTKSLVKQLNDVTNSKSYNLELSPLMMKVVSSSIPWLIALLIGAIVEKNDKFSLIGGLIVVGAIGVIVGIVLPWQGTIWSNYWLYPIIHFIVIIWALVLYGNLTKKSS